MKNFALIALVPFSFYMTVSPGPVLSGCEPLQTQKESPAKEANGPAVPGVNVTDKNGVLYIDGVVANEVQFKSDDVEVRLNNFQKNPNKYTFNGLDRDDSGICFFIAVKNKSKKSLMMQMIDSGSDRANEIVIAKGDLGGRYSCAYTNSLFILNGFRYGLFNPYKKVAPLAEHKDDLVMFTVNLDSEKVVFNVDNLMGKNTEEFYVLLKNLKKTEKRSEEFQKFLKSTPAKPKQ